MTLVLVPERVAQIDQTTQTAQAFGPILDMKRNNNRLIAYSLPWTPSAVLGVLLLRSIDSVRGIVNIGHVRRHQQ